MIKFILIFLIILVIYKIYTIYFQNTNSDPFINITNPFVDGLSQFQLGANLPSDTSIIDNNNLPTIAYNGDLKNKHVYQDNIIDSDIDSYLNDKINKKNVINKINKINQLADLTNARKPSKFNRDVNHIKGLKNKKLNLPCKKLNKFFVSSQFNDSYRDVLTAFHELSPDQKIIFNIQSLPVTTTKYDLSAAPLNAAAPWEFIKLITGFINKLNNEIKKLPDSVEIINDYNNYLPLTSQLQKYVKDKGINKFYKDIGVDYNLYADTPPNSPVELIKILKLTREFTEAETRYIATFVIKKILKSINDQLQITVHFVVKNDPLAGYNLFNGEPEVQSINSTQQIAIEYIWVDGFFTNDFEVDYECVGSDTGKCDKQVSNIDGDDRYYSFNALNENNFLSQHSIITEFNKKNREHELEMLNFNINVPYPVFDNPHHATPVKFPK